MNTYLVEITRNDAYCIMQLLETAANKVMSTDMQFSCDAKIYASVLSALLVI